MKSWKSPLFVILVLIVVLSLILSACGPLDGPGKDHKKDKDNGNNKDKDKNNGSQPENPSQSGKVTICHKTGSPNNPYIELTVPNDALVDGHGSHEGDLIPAPAGGCPQN